jgi:hypothetical protein
MLTHKALRLLNGQEWSVEFLTAMLIRASKLRRQDLEMDIYGKNGTKITVRTTDSVSKFKDENIFEHLDDEIKIQQFMEQLNKEQRRG